MPASPSPGCRNTASSGLEDYEIWATIFENITVVPDYDRYRAWQQRIGDDGVAVMMGTFSASPVHHIQRDFLDATEFFFHYNDHHKANAPPGRGHRPGV